jgi:DNA-binding NarL/FixJ family response regulator
VGQCLQAGADGYVIKFDTSREILTAIRLVLVDCQQSLAPPIRMAPLDPPTGAAWMNPLRAEDLTARERQVMSLVCGGLTNQQIADHLRLQVGTVKTYVERIKGKLGVSSRVQVAVAAHMLGIFTVGPYLS